VGHISGLVTTIEGRPVARAQVVATNEQASPSRFRVSTDGSGRFRIAGLQGGIWTLTFAARGFMSAETRLKILTLGDTPIVRVTLVRATGKATAPLPADDLTVIRGEILAADALLDSLRPDEAIAAYRGILARVPRLSTLHFQIAYAYRLKHDRARAVAEYEALLALDSSNPRARVELAHAHLEGNDPAAAEAVLLEVARAQNAPAEVSCVLGDAVAALGHRERAAEWYARANEADPTWARPLLRLGLLALERGDRDVAVARLEKALALEPGSPEAAEARRALDQVRK
jgi:TPR repeat protein